jgi:hypothetical protein
MQFGDAPIKVGIPRCGVQVGAETEQQMKCATPAIPDFCALDLSRITL